MYDRIGRMQDTQAFYEDAAIDDLIAHSDFGDAHRVVEIGCGTGRLARRLLDHDLPPDASYLGIELSPRMAALARERLRSHIQRSAVEVADAVVKFPDAADCADRVVAAYVFDLLGPTSTATLLEHVTGVLATSGTLCAVSLTDGPSGVARAVSRAWTGIWRRRPGLVGGCRPIQLADTLNGAGWSIEHLTTITAWTLTSEILVARPSES